MKEISKTQVGRVILKECGNEGTQDSEQKANLRRLLQGVIDNFKEGPAVRGNADIQVSDNFGYSVRIVSGKGEYKYVVLMNGSGEIDLKKTGSPPASDRMRTAFSSMTGYLSEKFSEYRNIEGGNS